MTLAERAQQFLKDYGLAIPEQYGTWQLVKDQADRIEQLEAALDRFREQDGTRIEVLEAALEKIEQWSRAYPLEVFPEPDLKRAHEILKAHGMGLDAISASAMRHVVKGVGEIVRAALEKGTNDETV